MSLVGVELPADEAIDSRILLPALLGESGVRAPNMIEEASSKALRCGDWKLIQPTRKRRGKKGKPPPPPGKGELYDLGTDIGEQNNVIHAQPEIAIEMSNLLKNLIESEIGVRAEAAK